MGDAMNGDRLIWRASGACSAVLCLGFSFQLAAAQAPIIQKQKAEAEAKEWGSLGGVRWPGLHSSIFLTRLIRRFPA